MVMSVVSPKKSLTEVFQRVGGYSSSSSSYGSHSQLKRFGIESEDDYDDDGTMELVQIGAERTKNVLILMSDTGGGHRASAEAIRDAFRIEFGDEYRVIGCFFCSGSSWALLYFFSFSFSLLLFTSLVSFLKCLVLFLVYFCMILFFWSDLIS